MAPIKSSGKQSESKKEVQPTMSGTDPREQGMLVPIEGQQPAERYVDY